MLQLEELYNFLEYEYNEDLDYIDDIYHFLQIIRIVQENENEELILEKMELLEEGMFLQLKNENIDIHTLHKLYNKYLSQKEDLELNINHSLNQYNKNIDDLIILRNNISNAICKNDLTSLHLLEYKKELWWDWINNEIISNIIKSKQGKTSMNITKIIICKKIFKYFNLLDKIENIVNYSNKLIIFDIKNYDKKYVKDYHEDLIYLCYNTIKNKIDNTYGNIFDINDKHNLDTFDMTEYLFLNENLYKLDESDNIVINTIDNDFDSFYQLNKMYNVYKLLKICLKTNFEENHDIILNEDINAYLGDLFNIINELNKEINVESINNEINQKIYVEDTVKNKYYIFINYLNNIVYLIFNYYFNNKIKKNSDTYIYLQKKYNYLYNNKKNYKLKV